MYRNIYSTATDCRYTPPRIANHLFIPLGMKRSHIYFSELEAPAQGMLKCPEESVSVLSKYFKPVTTQSSRTQSTLNR